jgi:hypothetical protein
MIPRIIHQTWKNSSIPEDLTGYVESWRRFHPDWQHRLWTDTDLAQLVEDHFPQYRDLFHAYELAIMRADLGRYLILKKFGGVYADLDAEALASFAPLLDSGVPVFACEPPSHAALEFVQRRGFRRLVSNAVMASPPGHPLWDHLLTLIVRCRSARGPLDATGPFILTAAIERFDGCPPPRVLPAQVFSPIDKFGNPVAGAPADPEPLAAHHWKGSWWLPPTAATRTAPESSARYKRWYRHIRDDLWAGFRDRRFLASIDRQLAARAAPDGRQVLVAIPVRDAAGTLDDLFRAILNLDYPRGDLSIAFLEGDSGDDSLARLRAFAAGHAGHFRRIALIKRDLGLRLDVPRWDPSVQRKRRANIARVRNALMREALQDEDWVLWIDSDIVDFPADALNLLLATGARIVHPNTVRRTGAMSMDLNAWVTERQVSREAVRALTRDRLYQPPPGHERLYLSDLRYLDRVMLDSVGCTMLLVDANLHRAGLIFPERPYRRLIESEAFASAALELGISAVGLPNLEILHSAR